MYGLEYHNHNTVKVIEGEAAILIKRAPRQLGYHVDICLSWLLQTCHVPCLIPAGSRGAPHLLYCVITDTSIPILHDVLHTRQNGHIVNMR